MFEGNLWQLNLIKENACRLIFSLSLGSQVHAAVLWRRDVGIIMLGFLSQAVKQTSLPSGLIQMSVATLSNLATNPSLRNQLIEMDLLAVASDLMQVYADDELM